MGKSKKESAASQKKRCELMIEDFGEFLGSLPAFSFVLISGGTAAWGRRSARPSSCSTMRTTMADTMGRTRNRSS